MSSSNGKDNSGPARTRYWSRHEKPGHKVTKRAGMQKWLRASDYTLMATIADLGSKSDVAVLRMASADLTRNRAFNEHQQKLRGAIQRLKRLGSIAKIPHRAELAIFKSAFMLGRD